MSIAAHFKSHVSERQEKLAHAEYLRVEGMKIIDGIVAEIKLLTSMFHDVGRELPTIQYRRDHVTGKHTGILIGRASEEGNNSHRFLLFIDHNNEAVGINMDSKRYTDANLDAAKKLIAEQLYRLIKGA